MHRIARPLVLLTAIFLGASSCSDLPSSSAPPAPAWSTSATAQPDLSKVALFRAKPSLKVGWAKAWIGPDGGRLDFHGFAIVVPAGAVSRVTQFSISLPVDPSASERVVAEFGPHNVTFAVPVTIELPLRGTSIETSASPFVVWWNPGAGVWVDMGGTITADESRLQTQVPHFSIYGTSEERGTGVVVSGG